MVAEHSLFSLSLFLTSIVFVIDIIRSKSSVAESFSPSVSSRYRKRFAVYFIIMLGIPIDIILHTWYYALSGPLIYGSLYFISFLIISISSALFAKSSDGILSESMGRVVGFHKYLKSPCWEKFTEYTSKTTYTADDAVKRILNAMSSDDILEWFIENLVTRRISEECVDDILWNLFFDRFETTMPGSRKFRRVSNREIQKYVVSKKRLLARDDEASKLFRQSLDKWRNEHYISDSS